MHQLTPQAEPADGRKTKQGGAMSRRPPQPLNLDAPQRLKCPLKRCGGVDDERSPTAAHPPTPRQQTGDQIALLRHGDGNCTRTGTKADFDSRNLANPWRMSDSPSRIVSKKGLKDI